MDKTFRTVPDELPQPKKALPPPLKRKLEPTPQLAGTRKAVVDTGPKPAFGASNRPVSKPKYEMPAELKPPKTKLPPKSQGKLAPLVKKEEAHVKVKHPPVPSVRDLRKAAQKPNDGAIGPDGIANIVINNTSANIETMDPRSGSSSAKVKMQKQLAERRCKEVVVKRLQMVGLLPSGKEVKAGTAKKTGDTLKRIAQAGAEKTVGGGTKAAGR